MVTKSNKVVKSGEKRPPNAGAGRKKGSVNKTTKSAKEAIEYAAAALGGGVRLAAWAKEDPANEKVFWGTIYPKMLPLQVTGEDGGALRVVLSNADEAL